MRGLSVFLIIMLTLGALLFLGRETKADWTYKVRRGDTMIKIARRTGVTVSAIKKRNGYKSEALRICQKLIIPAITAKTPPRRNSGDLSLLSKVINAEAGAEPYVGKVAIGGVILNRVQNPKFPKTIAGVIYQPNAFESVSNGTIYQPVSSESRKAAVDALNGWDPSEGALYFFNPAKTYSSWMWRRQIITQIGHHIFAL